MKTSLVRWFLVTSVVCVVVTFSAIVFSQTGGKPAPEPKETAFSGETWEYLVVSGLTTNLEPSGDSQMRKTFTSRAGREQFAVEKNLDKLGQDGWELVSVAGPPADPIYYLKRRK